MDFGSFFPSKHFSVSLLMNTDEFLCCCDKSIQLPGREQSKDLSANTIVLAEVNQEKSKIAVRYING
jgi:hypothetical protein